MKVLTEGARSLAELIQAKEANKLSVYNKLKKQDVQNELKKLSLKEQVAYKVSEAVNEGSVMKSFSSRTEVGRWIIDNKEELKDLGYGLSFFMGKSTIGDVRIEWRNF